MSQQGPNQRQLMQISEQLQGLEDAREELDGRINDIREHRVALGEAADTIGEIDEGDTVMVPLSEGVRVRATIESLEEVVVALGAGYAAELGEDDAVDVISDKQETLDEQVEELEDDMSEVEEQIDQLEAQAQQLQMQMQAGGQPDHDHDPE